MCTFPYLFEDPSFHQLLSLLTALLRGGWTRDWSAIEGNRNACKRSCSKDCDDEIEDDVSDVDIRGLFNDKSWERTIVFVDEVAFSDTSKKRG